MYNNKLVNYMFHKGIYIIHILFLMANIHLYILFYLSLYILN